MKQICLKGLVLAISLASYSVVAHNGTIALCDGPFSYGVGTESYFGSGSALDAAATLSTDFGVEVLNLTDSNGNPAQNQLVYFGQNVSDHVATLPLLAAGLAGLGILAGRARARPHLPMVKRRTKPSLGADKQS
jgi:hypothetical protein